MFISGVARWLFWTEEGGERERVDLRQKLLIEVASLWFPTVFNHSPKLAEMDLTIAEMELTSLLNMFMFVNLEFNKYYIQLFLLVLHLT